MKDSIDHTIGQMESKINEHSRDIEELKDCIEHKRRRIDLLETITPLVELQIKNFHDKFDKKEIADNIRHKDIMLMAEKAINTFSTKVEHVESKISKVDNKVSKYIWIITGAIGVCGSILMVFEKYPDIINLFL